MTNSDTTQASGKTLSYTTHSSFLREIKNGSESAWFEFYRKYAGMIRYIGQKRNLTPEECDDLMIEVMVIFWKRVDNFFYDHNKGKFRSYLGRITDSAALRIFKKSHNDEVQLETAELDYPDEIDANYMDEWRDLVIEKALEELKTLVDTEVYQIFYMSFFQKRPAADIAVISGKSVNNVYAIKSRCLKKLKELIAVYRQNEEAVFASHSQSSMSES